MLRFLLLILPLIFTIGALHAGTPPQVVASIKPLHSLAAMITRGVSQPALLLDSASDPHHFSLRPSQRRLIANADLVLWTGRQLEAALGKAIANGAVRHLALLDADLPVKLSARGTHHHTAEPDNIDPHIWLSPDNARAILQLLGQHLGHLDPANRRHYQRNLQSAIDNITQLEQDIENRLSGINKSYIAWHDSYRYFEYHFGLKLAGAIRSSDSQRISARELSHLHQQLIEGQVQCVVHDRQPMPDLLRRLPADANTRFAFIDILGAQLPAGETLWLELMRNTTESFAHCLAGGH